MTERRVHAFLFRGFVVSLLTLFLADCAGTGTSSGVTYAPAPGSYFTVKLRSGESLSEVAQHYGVNKDDLLALNDIANSDQIIAGADLRVPGYGRLREAHAARTDSVSRPERPPIVQTPAKRSSARIADGIPIPRPRPQDAATAPQASRFDYAWLRSFTGAETANTAETPKLLWPIQGRIISNFGVKPTGERNDGINILASRGTPVRAAAAGTVAYVGEELKNYGKLVLIRHEGSYVTAYAHSDTVTVSPGERVTRGQTIGYAGATGDVSEPQLHFELRLGTKAVDPKPYLVAAQ